MYPASLRRLLSSQAVALHSHTSSFINVAHNSSTTYATRYLLSFQTLPCGCADVRSSTQPQQIRYLALNHCLSPGLGQLLMSHREVHLDQSQHKVCYCSSYDMSARPNRYYIYVHPSISDRDLAARGRFSISHMSSTRPRLFSLYVDVRKSVTWRLSVPGSKTFFLSFGRGPCGPFFYP